MDSLRFAWKWGIVKVRKIAMGELEDKQMKGSSLKKIGVLLPWLWLAAGYVLDMWFQLVPGKWIVDSDLAQK